MTATDKTLGAGCCCIVMTAACVSERGGDILSLICDRGCSEDNRLWLVRILHLDGCVHAIVNIWSQFLVCCAGWNGFDFCVAVMAFLSIMIDLFHDDESGAASVTVGQSSIRVSR